MFTFTFLPNSKTNSSWGMIVPQKMIRTCQYWTTIWLGGDLTKIQNWVLGARRCLVWWQIRAPITNHSKIIRSQQLVPALFQLAIFDFSKKRYFSVCLGICWYVMGKVWIPSLLIMRNKKKCFSARYRCENSVFSLVLGNV